MTTYKIEYDIAELKKLTENFAKGLTTAALPNTDAAFRRAAKKVRQMWTGFLEGSVSLPGVENPSGVTSAMVRSIRAENLSNDTEFHQVIYSDNRQLIIGIDKGYPREDLHSPTPRIINTKSEDLFNLYGFDAYNKQIRIYRVGADIDMYMQHKNAMCINYITKQIVSDN